MREKLDRWLPRVLGVLVLLALAVPAFEFWWIALNRLTHPFELEWLEGEVALYTMRWLETGSISGLYPAFGQAEFVPHLYGPVFPVLAGIARQLFGGGSEGVVELAWGRGVSLVAVAALLAAIVLLVREATRSWLAGLAGAASYLAFFRVSGFWYDLYRVDSLAYALAAWSVWLAVRRNSEVFSLMLSFLLAVAAGLTKQTALFLPVLAWSVRVAWELGDWLLSRYAGGGVLPRGGVWFRWRRALPVGLFLAAVGSAGVAYILSRPEWEGMRYYLLTVPSEHFLQLTKIRERAIQELWQYLAFPMLVPALGAWAYLLTRRWKTWGGAGICLLPGVAASLVVYMLLGSIAGRGDSFIPEGTVKGSGLGDPALALLVASSWHGFIRLGAALLAGALVVLAIRWARWRTVLPGAWWLGVLLVAQHVAVLSWVKVGGYINNFIPLLFVMSVVLGLGFGWLGSAAARVLGARWRIVGGVAFVLLMLPGWWGTREVALALSPSDARLQQLPFHVAGEQARQLPPWVTDGLRASRVYTSYWGGAGAPRQVARVREPFGNQIPGAEAAEWGEQLLGRLRELAEEGAVHLPNQPYLATMAGLPPRESASAIREIIYLGERTPDRYLEPLRTGEYLHLVMMMPAENDWVTSAMRDVIVRRYRHVGPVLDGLPYAGYRPVTGAKVRPERLYRFRQPGDPEPTPTPAATPEPTPEPAEPAATEATPAPEATPARPRVIHFGPPQRSPAP